LKGYAEVVGYWQDEAKVYHGLNKKNTADALNKRIHRLEALEPKKDDSKKDSPKKDEPKKANRPSY